MRQIQTLQSFLHGKAASVQAHAAYNILTMQEKLLSADKRIRNGGIKYKGLSKYTVVSDRRLKYDLLTLKGRSQPLFSLVSPFLYV